MAKAGDAHLDELIEIRLEQIDLALAVILAFGHRFLIHTRAEHKNKVKTKTQTNRNPTNITKRKKGKRRGRKK